MPPNVFPESPLPSSGGSNVADGDFNTQGGGGGQGSPGHRLQVKWEGKKCGCSDDEVYVEEMKVK